MDQETNITDNLYYDERSAGGIVYKKEGDKVLFLLIKTFANKRRKTVFKFPKGHLNKDEVLKQAALREVEEEGRIKSKIVTKIGSNDYILETEGAKLCLEYTNKTSCLEHKESASGTDCYWWEYQKKCE